MSEDPIEHLTAKESIRRRPSMYIGSTKLFGLIHYFVEAVSFFLERKARTITLSVDGSFNLSADIAIQLHERDGVIHEFESYTTGNVGPIVLNALSERLQITIESSGTTRTLVYERGTRVSIHDKSTDISIARTTLSFQPDRSIFSDVDVPLEIVESYFRRLSYLHSGVRFAINRNEGMQEFYSANGMSDLFTAISSPFQLMHAPFHLQGQLGDLSMELIFAYQSWTSDHVTTFMNNGRAVEGGTHEEGLSLGLEEVGKLFGASVDTQNGIVALAAFQYPKVIWQGCVKAKVGNEELKGLVKELVVTTAKQWGRDHLSATGQISHLEVFTFPDVWTL